MQVGKCPPPQCCIRALPCLGTPCPCSHLGAMDAKEKCTPLSANQTCRWRVKNCTTVLQYYRMQPQQALTASSAHRRGRCHPSGCKIEASSCASCRQVASSRGASWPLGSAAAAAPGEGGDARLDPAPGARQDRAQVVRCAFFCLSSQGDTQSGRAALAGKSACDGRRAVWWASTCMP